MMVQIGTRDLRVPLMHGGVSAQPRIEAVRQALWRLDPRRPLRVTALVTAYLDDPATSWAAQQPALLAMQQAGLLRAIEGPNEINNRATGGGSHGPGDLVDRTGPDAYPANSLAWAQVIAEFRRRHAALAKVLLIAPSIASGQREAYAVLPSLDAYVDAANVHFYAGGGRQPGFSLPPNPAIGSFASVLAWARAAQKPAGPVWLTEAGASTSGNYARDGVSQAKYLANQLFDAVAAGATQVFFYQLIDGSGAAGDVEGNFGLFGHDGTAKPAALMLANLTRLLSVGDHVGTENQTSPVQPGIEVDRLSVSDGAHLLVLPKADGSTLVAVWNEPPIDDGHGHSLSPAMQPVMLALDDVRQYRVHDPLSTSSSAGRFDRGRQIALALRGHPLIVELLPKPR